MWYYLAKEGWTMKKFLAAALAAMLLLTVPGVALAAEEEREVPEGYVETTFCDLTYCIPEDWEALTWDDDQQDHLNYSLKQDGEVVFPLDVSAYDAISTMTDLALMDMLVMGEIEPGEAKADKLERWGKMELRSNTIGETEQCVIGGAPAVRFAVTTPTGYEAVHYYVLTEDYYYHFEFNYLGTWGQEVTEDIAETIDLVMDGVTVTPEEPAE